MAKKKNIITRVFRLWFASSASNWASSLYVALQKHSLNGCFLLNAERRLNESNLGNQRTKIKKRKKNWLYISKTKLDHLKLRHSL